MSRKKTNGYPLHLLKPQLQWSDKRNALWHAKFTFSSECVREWLAWRQLWLLKTRHYFKVKIIFTSVDHHLRWMKQKPRGEKTNYFRLQMFSLFHRSTYRNLFEVVKWSKPFRFCSFFFSLLSSFFKSSCSQIKKHHLVSHKINNSKHLNCYRSKVITRLIFT